MSLTPDFMLKRFPTLISDSTVGAESLHTPEKKFFFLDIKILTNHLTNKPTPEMDFTGDMGREGITGCCI